MDSLPQREPLLISADRGLFCPAGDFYIDAWQPVARNIVTHAHSDHARAGSEKYLTAADGAAVLRKRLGSGLNLETLAYGASINLNGVDVSLHPAGHILGSSQVRVEHRGEIWVFTGDYKLDADPTCRSFELLRCNTFITECTFGLPIYRWSEPAGVFSEINQWWKTNIELGRTSMLYAYSLGKAQRLLAGLDDSIGPILLHGAVHAMVETYRQEGIALPPAEYATVENAKRHRGRAIVIAPPSAMNSPWVRKFFPVSSGVASGWMRVRGMRRRRGADRGFVLSDHVDFDGLMRTIHGTGAEHIILTHGYTAPMVRFLNERGLHASTLETHFEGDQDESIPSANENAISSNPVESPA